MHTAQKNKSQGVLFSEPSVAETAVWCNLNPGIDPSQWAYVCRHLGSLPSKEFKKACRKVFGNPGSLLRRLKRTFQFEDHETKGVPLLSLGKLELTP